MTFVWLGILLVFLVLLLPLVVGLRLPERFEGETTHSFNASMNDVWCALMDYRKHPMTGKTMKSIEALAPENGLPCWTEDMGHSEIITVKTVSMEEPRSMVREMTSASVDMDSTWRYRLEAKGEGCNVFLEGVTHIRGKSWMVGMFRIMMRLGGGVKKGLDIQLDMVRDSLEDA